MPHTERRMKAAFRRAARRVAHGVLASGCVALMLMAAPAHVNAQPPVSREYQLKAIFLLNFSNFVEWPPDSFGAPNAPFCIGVLGADPFGSALDDAIVGESVHDHPVIVRRSNRPEDMRGCQIVFISASERPHLDRALGILARAPVLTVSDLPNFAREGGVVGFFIEANKVRFEINPVNAREHGLKLSSQLLSLARIAGGPER